MTKAEESYNFQKIVAVTGVLLLVMKTGAWYLTNSVAILTDALESTVNVTSAFIGLYSLNLSAKPKDSHHPYGHGRAEFISAAIEGTLIVDAGLLIIYEAIKNLLGTPEPIGKLDYGILLITLTAIINYLVGAIAIKKGGQNNSLALVASGKHLQSDTYSTIGIIFGLILLFFTRMVWLDSVVALLFALVIVFTGYRIIRDSLRGIMDEADEELLKKMVDLLEVHRSQEWIDLHNMRMIKYGSALHLDCHLTVPWYFNVHEVHQEIEKLARLVNENFGQNIELSVHTDGCFDFSCEICDKKSCYFRKAEFRRRIEWTVENISNNHKHHCASLTQKQSVKNSLQMFLLSVIALMCISVSACDNAADKVLSEGSKIGSGALKGSITEFSKTIKLDSTSAKVYVGRAAVKYANGDNRGAITDLTKAIELEPKSATAYSARATVKFSEDDISGSMADFMNAAKIVVLSSFRKDSGN